MKVYKITSKLLLSKSAQNVYLGLISACFLYEVVIRIFATGLNSFPVLTEYSLSNLPKYQYNDIAITHKQFKENISTSHFYYDGARRTGNNYIINGTNVIVLGDSFVEAVQVEDSQTVGYFLEKEARINGIPLNVRQYGWGGVGLPVYLAVAESIKQFWHPSWVIVLFNSDDLAEQAWTSGRFWKIEHDLKTNSYSLVKVERSLDKKFGIVRHAGMDPSQVYNLLGYSVLGYLILEKYALARMGEGNNENKMISNYNLASFKADEQKKQRSQLAVNWLKLKYENKLVIFYIPTININSTDQPEKEESLIEFACRSNDVHFVSLRQPMLRERDRNSRLATGFHNTAPGSGHLNMIGHRLLADEIWINISDKIDKKQVSDR